MSDNVDEALHEMIDGRDAEIAYLKAAIQAGCTAADVHLMCSYPVCSCKQMPAAIKAALALSEAKAAACVGALEKWKCPSCGGSGVYEQRSVRSGFELVHCKVCNGKLLHPTATEALSTLPARAAALVELEKAARAITDNGGGITRLREVLSHLTGGESK